MPPGPLERAPLAALEVFVAVGDHGSLSAAARALGVAQPSASAALRRLERRTGVALVTRAPSGTTLTDEGRRLLVRAAAVLRASDDFEAAASAERSQHAGHLVVAASMTIAEHLAPRWIAERTPGQAAVELLVANSRDVARAVLTGEAALGFVEGPDVDDALASRVVGTDELVVVVAPEHPWARRRRPVGALELSGTALAVRELGSGTRSTLERALAAAGAPAPRDIAQLGSTVAVKNLVRAGRHAAVLSRHAVHEEIAHAQLVAVEVDGIDLRRELRMVWSRGRQVPAAVEEFARVALRGLTDD
ncbi:LysR family transcriptional regulator [Cellulomonas soli]|uniref:LysR family transcriptional regulator n=1 Tax=Cellulomonas soli TaxID=931535 RepID=A0A512PCZ2_9CELL|nr:LysR family transcriptional regulator [Cellulomonas soli]NYI58577.1 DNA-binding transcriptional LysR family regulator [Cellulomonas soli]GEP69002.1 LysR family transcriptional regulator [Cellulomonas soli]